MNEGTFQKVGKSAKRMYGPKGILVCGYSPAEHIPLADVLGQIGFNDRPIVFVRNEDLNKTLRQLLNSDDRTGMGNASDMARAIVMSGFTQQELHMLMTAYRKAQLPKQHWATLTPVSENWTIKALLVELAAEARAFKKKCG
jgi:hypothetical protein